MQDAELKLYELYLAKIKETDEISFKLMGLVPFVSGAGVFVLLKGDKVFSSNNDFDLVVYWSIGLFGALITFFIYRWELRNIGTCRIFRDKVASMEAANDFPYKRIMNPSEMPKLLGTHFGKTQAEKSIYFISILFWILLPVLKTFF